MLDGWPPPELPSGGMGAARFGRSLLALMGVLMSPSIEEMPGTKALPPMLEPAGAGKEEERLSGGVGREEYDCCCWEFWRKGGRMPLVLLLLLLGPFELVAWSMDRCDMVVAGEEWKDGCVSAGVVAVIGERLLAMDEDIGCMPFC